MVTWGEKNFQNDDALKLINGITKTGVTEIEKILEKIYNYDYSDYLESPDCQMALAASEIIAASTGNASDDFPVGAYEWLDKNKFLLSDKKMVNYAIKVVERIKKQSELKELWKETRNFKNWIKVINDLEERLKKN